MRLEYFTAKWCQPCRWFGPVMGQFAIETEIPVEIIDIDKNPERLPLDVLGVPTVIMYEGDTEKARFSGAKTSNDLAEWIKVNG